MSAASRSRSNSGSSSGSGCAVTGVAAASSAAEPAGWKLSATAAPLRLASPFMSASIRSLSSPAEQLAHSMLSKV